MFSLDNLNSFPSKALACKKDKRKGKNVALTTKAANVAAVAKGNELKRKEKTVLFVCVENAGRSQMAEGFFNSHYAPDGYRAVSAGTKPAGHINQVAVEAMKEVGIDISKQRSKIITDDMIRDSVKAVNMGCMDKTECPTLFLHNPIDWSIQDPKGKSIERVRIIRDEIEIRVKELAANLK